MSLIRQVIATGLINFTNPFTNQLIFEVRLIPESFTISMFGFADRRIPDLCGLSGGIDSV